MLIAKACENHKFTVRISHVTPDFTGSFSRRHHVWMLFLVDGHFY